MRDYSTEAIIIKTNNFGEADKLLTLYTKEEGKIVVKAIGVRRIKSKLAGNLDLLNVVELQLVKGKTLDTITGARLISSHMDLKKKIKKVSLGCYFSELLYKLTPEKEKHEDIYELMRASLGVLEKVERDEDIDTLKSVFEYKLLSSLGHRPTLDVCVVCRNKYEPSVFFDFEHGGVVCEKCMKENSVESEPIALTTIKVLNAFEKVGISDIFKVKGLGANVEEASDVIKKFNYYIFNKIYKSDNFYKILRS